MDGDDAVKSLLGWTFDSPQGPIMIDPETRDIVMNEYLSEVVKGPDGKLHEKVLSETDHVKDECKAQAIGPCGVGRDRHCHLRLLDDGVCREDAAPKDRQR